MDKQQNLILHALSAIGAVNTSQLRRLLFEGGLSSEFDVAWPLAILREQDYLSQTAGESGIQYLLTEKGRQALLEEPLDAETEQEVQAKAGEYRELFGRERNFLAQYTEQANAVIPVFLSIRQNDKILFKISIIVHDVETAEKIKKNWMENAYDAYHSVWDCIAEGEPFPVFS